MTLTRSTTRRGMVLAVMLALVMSLPPVMAGTPESSADDRACPQGTVPSAPFADATGPHGAAIDCVLWFGVTEGQTDTSYGTQSNVQRGQTATFLVRLLEQIDGFTFPPRAHGAFPDVTDGPHQEAIERLAGFTPPILEGFEDGAFRSTDDVRRGQIASIVVRATDEIAAQIDGFDPLPAGGARFGDIAGSPHASAIDRLAAAGILQGFEDGTFRPQATATRGQMATVLMGAVEQLVAAGVLERPDGGPVPPVPPADPDAGVGAVDGTVTDAADDSGIEGADVALLHYGDEVETASAGSSTTTGAEGGFAIAEVAAGDYDLEVTAAGYQTATAAVTVTAGATVTQHVALQPVDPVDPVDPVVPVGSIVGAVVDDTTGEGIEGAAVAGDGLEATTDADGAYEMIGVDPGNYDLIAAHHDYESSDPVVVEVVQDEASEQGFELTALPGSLSGEVVDADTGDGLEGATVTLDGDEETTDADGAYSFHAVAPGDYDVTADHDGYEPVTRSVGIGPNADVTETFELALEAHDVNVWFRDRDGGEFDGDVDVTVGEPLDFSVLVENDNQHRALEAGWFVGLEIDGFETQDDADSLLTVETCSPFTASDGSGGEQSDGSCERLGDEVDVIEHPEAGTWLLQIEEESETDIDAGNSDSRYFRATFEETGSFTGRIFVFEGD